MRMPFGFGVGTFAPCLLAFGWLSAAQKWQTKIPKQLILTGKPETLDQLPLDIKTNILSNVRWGLASHLRDDDSSSIKLRWFGDDACRTYIQKYYDDELLEDFDGAEQNNFRGDICRAAVLYNEGGFYMDLDDQLDVPLPQLIDSKTTFMAVWAYCSDLQHCENDGMFNGLLAVTPKNEIMAEHLNEIRKWYRGESGKTDLLGPTTLFRGFQHVVDRSCRKAVGENLTEMRSWPEWSCGENNIRMYKEAICLETECSAKRWKAGLYHQIGFTVPGKPHNEFIGWPRFEGCSDDVGCGAGGHDKTPWWLWTSARSLFGNSFLGNVMRRTAKPLS